MATSKLRVLDGESIYIYSENNQRCGEIRMDNDSLKLSGTGSHVLIAAGNNLLFAGANATIGGSNSLIALGKAGDTVALDVDNVTYAFKDISASGNLTVTGTSDFASDVTLSTVKLRHGNYAPVFIRTYGSDANAVGAYIQTGGSLIVAGGEAGSTVQPNVAYSSEQLSLASDADVVVYSNLQNGWSSRKTWFFQANGNLAIPGNLTDGTNTLSMANLKDAYDKRHTQNTDSGTTSDTFAIYQGSTMAATGYGLYIGGSSTSAAPYIRWNNVASSKRWEFYESYSSTWAEVRAASFKRSSDGTEVSYSNHTHSYIAKNADDTTTGTITAANFKIGSNSVLTGVTASSPLSASKTGNSVTVSHITGDGFSHIPATSTTSQYKVLMAGSTANSGAWTAIFDSTAPTALSYGMTGSAGTSNLAARRDHSHTMPAQYSHPTGDGNSHVPATSTTNQYKVLMAGSTANSATWTAIFDSTAPSTQNYGDTAAAGTANIAARRDHKHAMPQAYSHPTHPGDDFDVDTGTLSGATVVSRVDLNLTSDTAGHVTDANGSVTTRTLTATDISLGNVWNKDIRDFGLGVTAANNPLTFDDKTLPTGFYSSTGGAPTGPVDGASGSIINVQSGASGGSVAQLWALANNETNERLFIRHCKNDGVFNSWREVYHTGNLTPYTHPTTAGNKHIPTGGASGQILAWSALGTAVWTSPTWSESTHTHDYLPLVGGTITGHLQLNGNIAIGGTGAFGSGGTGGFFQSTGNTSVGYGAWLTYNALYDGSKWTQPRGTLPSFLFTCNNHQDIAWFYAANNGTHGAQITPTKIASLTSAGNLNIQGQFSINSVRKDADWDLAYSHISSDGTSHTYIDQDLRTTATPIFKGMETTKDVYLKNGDDLSTWRNDAKISLFKGITGRIVNPNPDFLMSPISSAPAADFSTIAYGWNRYNNSGGSTLTGEVISDPNAPNVSGKILKVSYNGGGSVNPGYGGVHVGPDSAVDGSPVSFKQYRKGNRYLYRLWAKVPTDYTVNFASNATGTPSTVHWLTTVNGSGDWREYICIKTTGTTGSFSGTGFFYVGSGPNQAFDWYVASCYIIGLDEVPTVDASTHLNVGFKANTQIGWGEIYAVGKITTDSQVIASSHVDVGGNLNFGDRAASIVIGTGATARTLTITNSGTGVANLTVEGTVTATTLIATAQVNGSNFRTTTTNTNYSHFVRVGGGAAVYINQADATNDILACSGGIATAGSNLRFRVANNGRIYSESGITVKEKIHYDVTSTESVLQVSDGTITKFLTLQAGSLVVANQSTAATTNTTNLKLRLKNAGADNKDYFLIEAKSTTTATGQERATTTFKNAQSGSPVEVMRFEGNQTIIANLDVTTLSVDGLTSDGQISITTAAGTPPLLLNGAGATLLVNKLNADQVDGFEASQLFDASIFATGEGIIDDGTNPFDVSSIASSDDVSISAGKVYVRGYGLKSVAAGNCNNFIYSAGKTWTFNGHTGTYYWVLLASKSSFDIGDSQQYAQWEFIKCYFDELDTAYKRNHIILALVCIKSGQTTTTDSLIWNRRQFIPYQAEPTGRNFIEMFRTDSGESADRTRQAGGNTQQTALIRLTKTSYPGQGATAKMQVTGEVAADKGYFGEVKVGTDSSSTTFTKDDVDDWNNASNESHTHYYDAAISASTPINGVRTTFEMQSNIVLPTATTRIYKNGLRLKLCSNAWGSATWTGDYRLSSYTFKLKEAPVEGDTLIVDFDL
jgi:hypothetical protein